MSPAFVSKWVHVCVEVVVRDVIKKHTVGLGSDNSLEIGVDFSYCVVSGFSKDEGVGNLHRVPWLTPLRVGDLDTGLLVVSNLEVVKSNVSCFLDPCSYVSVFPTGETVEVGWLRWVISPST